MRKIILSLLMVIGVQMTWAQQDDNLVTFANQLRYDQLMADSLQNLLKNGHLNNRERIRLKKTLREYKLAYKLNLHDYNKMAYTAPINKAGKHLKRSANYQLASLAVGIVGGGLTAVCATKIEANRDGGLSSDGKTAVVCSVGITTGCAALGLYIASIVNKRKAGIIMSRINFDGNTVSYRF